MTPAADSINSAKTIRLNVGSRREVGISSAWAKTKPVWAAVLLGATVAEAAGQSDYPCLQIFHSQASFNPSSAPRTEQGRLQARYLGLADSRGKRVSTICNTDLRFRGAIIQDDGEPVYVWRDSAEDNDSEDLLELVIHSTQVDEITRKTLEVAFQRSHGNASDDVLAMLQYNPDSQPADKEVEEEEDEYGLKADDPDARAAQMRPLVVSNSNAAAQSKKPSPAPAQPEPATVVLEEPAVTATADLYLYDAETQMFKKQDTAVGVVVKETGIFLYWLSIASADKRWVSQRVDVDMNMNFSNDQLSAVWNFFQPIPASSTKSKNSENSFNTYSWLLRFPSQDAYDDFQTAFAKLMWETLHEEKWSAAKT
ncbi:unnamed protein product [Tilletia controversa]|uniref:Vid27 PH-like domain-containing protein n=2 Tax=Tilletia TaxID=13289 RepID=A0A8X7MTX6_9BASI|nr:hypothetical protein CF336_g1596 [Tilletia laevis]KAE8204929.1 hypothetical protein CF328_g795 [Tilletia controversa]KAE8261955.1 hypothetical protein A4X03_0g2833 [Tilletia caries]KAE8207080.1 hypothetical protein CF335_g1411 [Tilletia laevis]KAE8248217.1 hypothetical protein A4X06_0g3875 [Tilletia controversa]